MTTAVLPCYDVGDMPTAAILLAAGESITPSPQVVYFEADLTLASRPREGRGVGGWGRMTTAVLPPHPKLPIFFE